ncbi:hypothetical protein JDV02_010838 [Purpureocillium takamizusanense]|uniref:Uncharacterized protein n=1 Tax=Purpureocillium takamizusanense TaxID=2060973 RepID=A0A9Q8VGA9_9HYPO|nr:uncharacterized protein JDV02_010838 [Purpureocillium takamizusanense]UNI23749.1 hypothetical protein JDV02_010838 [Purpureocillium takamizusanense]
MNTRSPLDRWVRDAVGNATNHGMTIQIARDDEIEDDSVVASDEESQGNLDYPEPYSACGGEEVRGNSPPPASLPPRLVPRRQTVPAGAARRGLSPPGLERCQICGNYVQQYDYGTRATASRRSICRNCKRLHPSVDSYVSGPSTSQTSSGSRGGGDTVHTNVNYAYMGSQYEDSDTYATRLVPTAGAINAYGLSISASEGGIYTTDNGASADRVYTSRTGGINNQNVYVATAHGSASTSMEGGRRSRRRSDRRYYP